MKNHLKYIFAIVMATACKGGNQDMAKTPEETLTSFYAAVSQGDFRTARQLCDTISMAGYLNENESRWENMRQLDSNMAEIAAMLLSSVEIDIMESEKDGDKRILHYAIDATRGMKKNKTAILTRQEEGEWRVEAITDEI